VTDRTGLDALATANPRVAAFLKSIPLSRIWLADPGGDPIGRGDVMRLVCGRGCALAGEGIRALNGAIRGARSPVEQIVGVACDGHRHEILVKTLPIEVGGVRRALIALRDVSVEQELKEALRAAHHSLREIAFDGQCTPSEAAHLALNDPLTTLPNRRAFDIALAEACARGRAALCLTDLDRFKLVNDALGHSVGDRLLQAVGRTLRTHTRGKDFVARLAGDEFAILLHDIETPEAANEAVERILSTFRARLDLGDVDVQVSASGGVALVERGAEPAAVARRADVALHGAKARRNGTHCGHGHGAETLGEHERLGAVKRILERADVPLKLADIVAKDGTVLARDATITPHRSADATLDALFATAGRFGLDTEFLLALLTAAARAAADGPAVQLKLPAAAFGAADLAASVATARARTGCAPGSLRLEVPCATLGEAGVEDRLVALGRDAVPLVYGNWDFGMNGLDAMGSGRFVMATVDAAAAARVMREDGAARLARAATGILSDLGIASCARGVDDGAVAARLHALGLTAVTGLATRPMPASSRRLAPLVAASAAA